MKRAPKEPAQEARLSAAAHEYFLAFAGALRDRDPAALLEQQPQFLWVVMCMVDFIHGGDWSKCSEEAVGKGGEDEPALFTGGVVDERNTKPSWQRLLLN